MTPKELDALEALLAKGTARPWREAWTDPQLAADMASGDRDEQVLIAGPGEPAWGKDGHAVMGTMWWDGPNSAGTASNCALIVGAVNALPKLIEEIRALAIEVGALRAVADGVPALINSCDSRYCGETVDEMERLLATALKARR